MAEEFIPMDSVAEVSLCIVRGGYYSAQSIIAFFLWRLYAQQLEFMSLY